MHSAGKHESVNILPGAFTLCWVRLEKRRTFTRVQQLNNNTVLNKTIHNTLNIRICTYIAVIIISSWLVRMIKTKINCHILDDKYIIQESVSQHCFQDKYVITQWEYRRTPALFSTSCWRLSQRLAALWMMEDASWRASCSSYEEHIHTVE